MPLRIEGIRLAHAFGWGIGLVLERLPIVALVAAAQDIRLTEERVAPILEVKAETKTEAKPVENGDAGEDPEAEDESDEQPQAEREEVSREQGEKEERIPTDDPDVDPNRPAVG